MAMYPGEALHFAIIVALLIVVAYMFLNSKAKLIPVDSNPFVGSASKKTTAVKKAKAKAVNPTSDVISPYVPLAMQVEQTRLMPKHGNKHETQYTMDDWTKNNKAWSATPRDLADAQREAWFEATDSGSSAFDPEISHNQAASITQHFDSGPSIDYQTALTDLVADDQMRNQQSNWAAEVAPKSMTALKADNMDEAAAIGANNGHGLYAFRFSGARVNQHNPLMLTDQDASDYAAHTTAFSFGG
jgi:hypothetical protein